jgi:hypothetical protein
MNKIICLLLLVGFGVVAGVYGRDSGTVKPVPADKQSLTERWAWAEGQARVTGQARIYIAYSIGKKMGPGHTFIMGDERGARGVRLGERLGMKMEAESDEGTRQLARRMLNEKKGRRAGDDRVVRDLIGLFEMDYSAGKWRLAGLTAGNPESRIVLKELPIYWLGPVSDHESLDHLAAEFKSCSDANLQEKLVAGIGMHDLSEKVVPLLKAALGREHPEAVRKSAVFWLSQQAGQKVCPTLEAIVGDRAESRVIRETAVFALSQHEQGVDALIRLAEGTGDPVMRKKAIFWLGQSDDERGLKTILKILEK